MKLIKARIQNFRSVEDSTEFDINDLTCLVGKNEAGKTAILQAIEAQRPYSKATAVYDITKEYPRRFVTQFEQRHPNEDAVVCATTWSLSSKDKDVLVLEFGNDSLMGEFVTITSGYEFEGTRWSSYTFGSYPSF
jgi:predicted ATP-dependent endonuclease of OLD family